MQTLHDENKVIFLKQSKAHAVENGLVYILSTFISFTYKTVPEEMMSRLLPCGGKDMGQCVRCDIVFRRLAYALWATSIRSFSSCHHARTSGSQATIFSLVCHGKVLFFDTMPTRSVCPLV